MFTKQSLLSLVSDIIHHHITLVHMHQSEQVR